MEIKVYQLTGLLACSASVIPVSRSDGGDRGQLNSPPSLILRQVQNRPQDCFRGRAFLIVDGLTPLINEYYPLSGMKSIHVVELSNRFGLEVFLLFLRGQLLIQIFPPYVDFMSSGLRIHTVNTDTGSLRRATDLTVTRKFHVQYSIEFICLHYLGICIVI